MDILYLSYITLKSSFDIIKCLLNSGKFRDWEVEITKLNTSLFIIPEAFVKNGDERLVLLNSVAKSMIESMLIKSVEYVFTYKFKPIKHLIT